jgi:hypothetical protein
MTEEVFHNHICHYLKDNFGYRVLPANDLADKEYYFVESHLVEFIQKTQKETWDSVEVENINTFYYIGDKNENCIDYIDI